jgi:hypothetical protein
VGSLAAFSNNVIVDCEEEPLVIEFLEQASIIDEASQLVDNVKPYVSVGNFENLQQSDISLKKLTVPWFITNGVYFQRKLTIAPGSTFLFDNDTFFAFEDLSTLIANGTNELPITFKHSTGTVGGWQGLYFYSSNLANSIQYCIVENGGSYSPSMCNIYIANGTRLTIQNTTVRNTTGYGIIRSSEDNVSATNLVFSGCALGNVYNEDEDIISETL